MSYKSPDWDKNPPTVVGQTRRTNGIERSPAVGCNKCGKPFWPRRGQAMYCDECKVCANCGKRISFDSIRTHGFCKQCAKKILGISEAKLAQLKALHKSIEGENNPAKREDVKAKIRLGVGGDKHWTRLPQWEGRGAEHMDNIRPIKTSKLECSIEHLLTGYERQYKVRWYALDYADPEGKIAIEVMGCWHHCCPVCFPDSPTYDAQRLSFENDRHKLTYLLNRDWTVVYLWQHDIESLPPNSSIDDLLAKGFVFSCIQ